MDLGQLQKEILDKFNSIDDDGVRKNIALSIAKEETTHRQSNFHKKIQETFFNDIFPNAPFEIDNTVFANLPTHEIPSKALLYAFENYKASQKKVNDLKKQVESKHEFDEAKTKELKQLEANLASAQKELTSRKEESETLIEEVRAEHNLRSIQDDIVSAIDSMIHNDFAGADAKTMFGIKSFSPRLIARIMDEIRIESTYDTDDYGLKRKVYTFYNKNDSSGDPIEGEFF